jgi:hypothetical protein
LNFEMNKLKLIRMPCAGLGRSFELRPAAGGRGVQTAVASPSGYCILVTVLASNTEKKSKKGDEFGLGAFRGTRFVATRVLRSRTRELGSWP